MYLDFFYKSYFGYPRKQFGYVGKNVSFTPPMEFSNPKNVFLYENTVINKASIYTNNAKFIMKANSMSAEGLRVSTGNHVMVIGRFSRDITEADKPAGYDKDVIVESDVWLGRNVILLSGVTIGRGSTIAAGAVVNRSIPPYCVAGGVPAKFIKFKWTIDEIMQHEKILYPEDERITKNEMIRVFNM